ncbi:hypothetical protein B0H19DRAFT_1112267 [Mycena capillaripes]|nr:hypothetical protein B0H19DRAFT_1112267 [Mycena capillaripes]
MDADAVVGAAGTCLSIIGTFAQMAPVPYAQPVISLGESILTMVQRVRSNKTGFQQLAKDIRDLVRAAQGSHVQSSHMEKNLRNLISLLKEIRDFVQEHTSHGVFRRIVSNGLDASKIQDYRQQIQQALNLFELKTQISTHENTERILKALEDRRRNASQQPKDPEAPSRVPACSATLAPSAAIPPPCAAPSVASPSISLPPPIATLTRIMNTTIGNFENCTIGAITMTTITGDQTTATVYR